MSNFQDNPEPARLRANALRAKLQSQRFVVGTFLEIPSPSLVELLGLAGFDFVVVDCEHAAISPRETTDLIRASLSTRISVMVRVPSCERAAISQPLDMGAAGIHVPQIESVEMAKTVVSSSKYHPLGGRGLQAYVRSASYRSYSTEEYLTSANNDTLIVAQVEGEKGLSSLEAIAKVDGLDVVFLGPYDLSQSLGIPGQVKHARVRNAMAEAIRVTQRHGKCVGTYGDDVETAVEYRDMGVPYLIVGIDAGIFLAAARSVVAGLKT